jgi:hypothetical protein
MLATVFHIITDTQYPERAATDNLVVPAADPCFAPVLVRQRDFVATSSGAQQSLDALPVGAQEPGVGLALDGDGAILNQAELAQTHEQL